MKFNAELQYWTGVPDATIELLEGRFKHDW
jgi:hypothetical protein